MSSSKVSKTAGTGSILCPLFMAHSHTEVHCEGPTEECRIIMRFIHREQLDQQENIFCKGRYDCCEWYRTMEAMKGGDEDD